MINVNKLYPDMCKHSSCLNRAMYEFTNTKDIELGGSLEANEYKKTITNGYSCEHHVVEVNKLLKEIYYGNKESNNIQ